MTDNESPPTPGQGTYEDAVQLLDVRSPINQGSHPVSAVRIAQFCSVIRDANPCYWDDAASTQIWGRPVAPPAMLQSWTMSLAWLPDRTPKLDCMLLNLPVPGRSIINVSTDTRYHRPIYVGETISFWDMATEISELKETRLGTGRFITTVAEYSNEAGEHVATSTNVQFRFTPRADE